MKSNQKENDLYILPFKIEKAINRCSIKNHLIFFIIKVRYE